MSERFTPYLATGNRTSPAETIIETFQPKRRGGLLHYLKPLVLAGACTYGLLELGDELYRLGSEGSLEPLLAHLDNIKDWGLSQLHHFMNPENEVQDSSTALTALRSLGKTVAATALGIYSVVNLRRWAQLEAEYSGTAYALTDRRVMKSTGVFGRDLEALAYSHIRHTQVAQDFTDRLARTGSITVTWGEGENDFVYLWHIDDPQRTARLLGTGERYNVLAVEVQEE